MFGNEITSHLLVTFIYFLIVSVLRFKFDANLILLWTGALVGTFLLDIDHLLWWFYLHPEKEDSVEVNEIWKTKGFKGAKEIFRCLERYHFTHNRLVFHSAVFQVVLLLLAFYFLTSSGDLFASALIMAVNLHLLKDEWWDFFKRRENLADWLFWQIKGFTMNNLNIYMAVISSVFLMLTVLLIGS